MSLRWLPNAICVFRILLVAPVVVALLEERYLVALVLTAVAGVSDLLDGFLARTFGWRTPIGSFLDPAADKLLIVSVFVTLTVQGLIPVALAVLVVARDLVIVGGAAVYRILIAPFEGRPTLISKLNTACQIVFVLSTLTELALRWPARVVVVALGSAVVFTSIASGLYYVVDWSKRAWRGTHATT